MFGDPPFIVRLQRNVNPFVMQGVRSRVFLVFRCKKIPTAPLMHVGSTVQQKLHRRRVLVADGHVQNRLTVVLVRQVVVVDHFRKMVHQPLAEFVMRAGCVQVAEVKNRFASSSTFRNVPTDFAKSAV